MPNSYDIAIVGSGFAGSLMAMIARRLGYSVVLIEKGKHPRVVIGESSTPLTNLLLEELANRYDLPALRPLTKWGSWQRTYPEIACGLKRGFTFYPHNLGQPLTSPPDRSRQLLVAASPNDEIADTHWYRADFDHFFVRQAEEFGLDYFDETTVTSLSVANPGYTLEATRKERKLRISADFLIDASGPRGFLHHKLGIGELELPGFPATQALFSHFTGVEPLEHLAFGANLEPPPYPIDDAAVHHVFDGGWVWVLRFNNGVTSAGVAATEKLASELNYGDKERAWQRVLLQIPALQAQFVHARHTRPFIHIPRLSFRSAALTGRDWAMLPSTGGFVDPLLSTGFPLTLIGIARLAAILEEDWRSDLRQARLDRYAAETDAELLAAARLIAALYTNMSDFPVFSALSLLYFAAVSYAETACRLGKQHLAGNFLLHDHPIFGQAMRALLQRAHTPRSPQESAELIQHIYKTIEPFNVAGFGDSRRRNWYPVDLKDLLQASSKLNAGPDEIAQMLRRCGLEQPDNSTTFALEPSAATSMPW